MGRDECKSVGDVEEGEISDSASVEEISEEDFNKQEAKVTSTTNSNSNSNSKPRVWTMGDLYKYSNSRNYVSGLYNLAWAQAVQNKPLNDVLVMEFKPSENSNLRRSSSSTSMNGREDSKNNSSSSISSSKEVNNSVVIDVSGDDTDDAKMEDIVVEKEEGELEEGEIDLDSEIVDMVEEGKLIANDSNDNKADADLKEELQKRVNSIREELETVTVNNAEKSYDAVCFRLQNSLDLLREVFLQNSVPSKDDIVQLSFAAIQTVNSVYHSMNQNRKEQNREILSRLLGQVTCENTPFLSPEQIKEVEALGSPAVVSITADSDLEKKIQVVEKVNQNDSDASGENAGHDLSSSKKLVLDSRSIEYLYPNDSSLFPEPLKLGPGCSKGRGVLLPLLDLHKDHDADSLPSPTRETPPRLPVNRVSAVGDIVFKPDLLQPRAALDMENSVMHPYETDALKAVSTYQQKFGRSSFILKDRLPSPTPSEECDDGDGGSSGEVSSSSIVGDANSVYAPILARPSVSSAHHMDVSSGQGLNNAGNAGVLSSGSNHALRALARSRDPRLRYANSSASALDLNQSPLPGVNNEPKVDPLGGTISSKKQKIVEELVLDGPALKRQRNGLTDSGLARDVHTASGSGGWLEDGGTIRPQFINRNQAIEKMGSITKKLESEITYSDATSSTPNVTIGGNEQLPVTVTSTTASLHSILKDIAVNPAMLMNIIKMEQQKSADPAKSTTQSSSSNSILGAVPLMNVAPPKPSELGQRSAGILQTPQTASPNMQDELGKVRMKPRDPRRVLHINTFQKPGSLGSDQLKTNVAPTASSQGMRGNLYPQKQGDLSDKNSVPSQSIPPPDIALQFTKNLKNIADIVSVSLAPMSPAISQNFPSQPLQIPSSRIDVKGAVVSESGNLQRTGSSTEEVAADPSGSKNNWGDVEHLFEGYDDQQKAAIQKERARRIAEQKKMFAARKLCLVLDLDHTLLNSAKFVEVDSVHDEILRKKEEQDREKPQRQLFRFPHMGMWTKLRPGIWNFLEKASKLFELHLYTMGNKLYATEMAKLLDPTGVLFAGRVISRGDDGDLIDGDERVPKSKDLEGVLGMESSVVIIDDSIKVWPHNKLNLIVVERYIYFPCSRRQFGLPGPSLLEIDHDERSEDGTLASSLAVIERIHQNFFSHRSLDEADVRNILASEQQKILGGCRIVFSRVFPVGEANPHLHPLWQTAEQFGAVCVNQIDEQVTHVVANSLGTDKVNWALSTGRFVVHPGWVEASALLYRRVNELDFAIKP